jgi:NAD(P)-dependent dehydrogenase (short-subunit alcohol dehydrogenase family)
MSADALSGRTVVLTGASRGLGSSMAKELAKQGATVLLLARSADRLAEVAGEIEAAGGTAHVLACDLADSAAVVAAAEAAHAAVGEIDVLINNAGMGWDVSSLKSTDAEIAALFQVNVFAAMALTRELGRFMTARGSGKVINVSSAGGLIGIPSLTIYGASKAAIAHWTRSLAAEWARYGVTVNAVAPGLYLTEMNGEALADPAVQKRVLADVPLRRFGDSEQLGQIVAFLSSSASDFITGQVLAVDGGMSSAI